jgi:hypothetical protein
VQLQARRIPRWSVDPDGGESECTLMRLLGMDGGLQKELMIEARFDRGASESNGSLRQNTPNGESTISLTYKSKTPSVRSIWSYSSVMVVDLFLLLFDWTGQSD